MIGRAELQWCFPGQEISLEENMLTALEFDRSGDMVATGNKSGKLVLYILGDSGTVDNIDHVGSPVNHSPAVTDRKTLSSKAQSPTSSPNSRNSRKEKTLGKDCANGSSLRHSKSEWSVYHQFLSHATQFDYLKSVEVEPKINMIKFCQPVGSSTCLLTTNDKCIKLWKVSPQSNSFVPGCVASFCDGRTARHFSLPYKMTKSPKDTRARSYTRRVYNDAHAYHINSLSLCADGESFLSADDLRINMWHLERSDVSLTVTDVKPVNMEDLAEVITVAAFHPTDAQMLLYATSRGLVKMADLRQHCLTSQLRVFEEPEEANKTGYFSEIIASISGLDFNKRNSNQFVTRDYMSVKQWDMRMENRAVKTINIHEHLRPLLCELYEVDAVCDKFEVQCSSDGRKFVTGTYSNQFVVKSMEGITIGLGQLPPEGKTVPGKSYGTEGSDVFSSKSSLPSHTDCSESPEGPDGCNVIKPIAIARGNGHPEVRVDQKIQHVAFHPFESSFAVASHTGLYIYSI